MKHLVSVSACLGTMVIVAVVSRPGFAKAQTQALPLTRANSEQRVTLLHLALGQRWSLGPMQTPAVAAQGNVLVVLSYRRTPEFQFGDADSLVLVDSDSATCNGAQGMSLGSDGTVIRAFEMRAGARPQKLSINGLTFELRRVRLDLRVYPEISRTGRRP